MLSLKVRMYDVTLSTVHALVGDISVQPVNIIIEFYLIHFHVLMLQFMNLAEIVIGTIFFCLFVFYCLWCDLLYNVIN